jgi:hypothetical protein
LRRRLWGWRPAGRRRKRQQHADSTWSGGQGRGEAGWPGAWETPGSVGRPQGVRRRGCGGECHRIGYISDWGSRYNAQPPQLAHATNVVGRGAVSHRRPVHGITHRSNVRGRHSSNRTATGVLGNRRRHSLRHGSRHRPPSGPGAWPPGAGQREKNSTQRGKGAIAGGERPTGGARPSGRRPRDPGQQGRGRRRAAAG